MVLSVIKAKCVPQNKGNGDKIVHSLQYLEQEPVTQPYEAHYPKQLTCSFWFGHFIVIYKVILFNIPTSS